MKRLILIFFVAVLVSACGKVSGDVEIETSEGTLILTPMMDNAVRVRMMGNPTHEVEELIFTEKVPAPRFKVVKNAEMVEISTQKLTVRYHYADETLSFLDAEGRELFREKSGSRMMKPSEIMGDPTYETCQTFEMQEDDHQFGTGQFQDGVLDIFGHSRRLTQNNTQIVSPMVISSKGYGILWHNYGRTEFNPGSEMFTIYPIPGEFEEPLVFHGRVMPGRPVYEGTFEVDEDGMYSLLVCVGREGTRGGHQVSVDGIRIIDDDNAWLPTVSATVRLSAGKHTLNVVGSKAEAVELYVHKSDCTTTFYSPVSQNYDYAVFSGSADEVIAAYRKLTGPVPRMQDWAFGFIQCRERYDTQAELLENAKGFKDRNIPVDLFVQDWKWWGETGWNSMVFDKNKYPDPKAMVDSIHSMGYKAMISVWSRVEHGTVLGDAIEDKGYFIPGTEWIDYFNPEAADYYWRNFRDSLVVLGFDGWWFDATEPDNDYELLDRRVKANTIPGDVYRNVYPLVANRSMYNGFKEYYPADGMPVVLTRSAFAGSQRYGVITWSGDISGTWASFRRQIVGGLGQSSAGLPWWTYDAGGFSRPVDQYTNEDYQEVMLRFIETAVFLPFMRVHGMSSHTEPWNYSDETNRIYVENIKLRYQLQPYILEVARRVSEEGYTMMRPLVFDFASDPEALKQTTEYMFGPDYLVCPVTEPKVQKWSVYLPVNEAGWEDFRTGEHYDGGQYLDVPVTLEAIPVFKRL